MARRMRPYRKGDLPALIDLLVAARRDGGADAWPTAIDLRIMLRAPSFDAAMHTCLWEGVDGGLDAGAFMWEGSPTLVYAVHPARQGGDYDERVLAWAMNRVHEMGREVGERLGLIVRPRDDNAGAVALLEKLGFARREWHTLRMARALDAAIPAPRLPGGFTLRHVAGEQEAEACVALHRDAFDAEYVTLEDRLAWMRDPDYDPALDLVAVAPDGTLAAFCVCSISREENARRAEAEGWTDPIGTRPAFRRQGLARALLLEGFQRLRERGVRTALLGTANWNEARYLYESVGYHTQYTILAYAREI